MILLKQEPAGAGLRTHSGAGHRHMSNSDTLVSVIDGVRQQDPERWRQFDGIYRPMLVAYLRKQGLKESDVNDVIQDTFVKLLGKIHTYKREKSSFRAWLFSVAHNTLIDNARRRASYQRAMDGWVANVLRATASDSVAREKEWKKIHREKILAHALKTIRRASRPRPGSASSSACCGIARAQRSPMSWASSPTSSTSTPAAS